MTTTFAQPVNNYATTLASTHSAGSGTLVLSSSPGTLGAGRVWRVTALANANTPTESVLAIFEATGNTGATLTGVTAAEGTTDVTLSAGAVIEIRMTAKDLSEVQAAVNANEVALQTVMISAVNAQTGTTYTLVLGDAAKMVTLSNASPVTLTIPLNASVAFPVNAQIDLAQLGSGQVTVTATGGVTLNSYAAKVKLAGQYAGATLKQTATDVWILIGNLS